MCDPRSQKLLIKIYVDKVVSAELIIPGTPRAWLFLTIISVFTCWCICFICAACKASWWTPLSECPGSICARRHLFHRLCLYPDGSVREGACHLGWWSEFNLWVLHGEWGELTLEVVLWLPHLCGGKCTHTNTHTHTYTHTKQTDNFVVFTSETWSHCVAVVGFELPWVWIWVSLSFWVLTQKGVTFLFFFFFPFMSFRCWSESKQIFQALWASLHVL